MFLAILSSNSIRSQWVNEELRVAYQKRIETDGVNIIIPVLIEKCQIPVFLKDYRFVSFQNKEEYAKAFCALCDSIIFRDDLVRKYQEIYPGNIVIDKAEIHGTISGSKYDIVKFVECYHIIPFRPVEQYFKEITIDGKLNYFNSSVGDIEQKSLGSNRLRFNVNFGQTIEIGSPFQMEFEYELENEFSLSPNWFYVIESPTRKLLMELKFQNCPYPEHFRVERKRSLFTVEECIIQPKRDELFTSFFLDRDFPHYGDRFELSWDSIN